jgi:predicted trehalose synthase
MSKLTPAQELALRLRLAMWRIANGDHVVDDVLADAADLVEQYDAAIRAHQDYKQSDRTAVVADHADLELWSVLHDPGS